jgi:hypothetical protein
MNETRQITKRDVKLMQALQIYSGVFPTDMVHFQLNFAAKKETNRHVLTQVIGSIIKLIRLAKMKLTGSDPILLLIMIDIKSENPLPLESNMFLIGNNTLDYVPYLATDFYKYCQKIEAEGNLSGIVLERKRDIWEIFSQNQSTDFNKEDFSRDIKIITPFRALILGEDFLKIHFNFHINHGFKG